MNALAVSRPETAAATHPWFSPRRVLQPVLRQLTLGVTPDRIALTLGVGTACSLFPFLGFTTLLNLGVGLALRLNQPILQTLNQLLGPVQLLLILVHVRIGEWLWRTDAAPFSVGEMIRRFDALSWRAFLTEFGWAGIHAFAAWLVTMPPVVLLTYLGLRPLLRRAAARLAS